MRVLGTLLLYQLWPLCWRQRSISGPTGAPERPGVLERLAEELYRLSLLRGGWATDVGMLGPEAFLQEASYTIASIALGNGEEGPPLP